MDMGPFTDAQNVRLKLVHSRLDWGPIEALRHEVTCASGRKIIRTPLAKSWSMMEREFCYQ